MKKQYRDEIAMVCHDTMKAIHRVGGVSDTEMKEFEADCYVKEPEPEFQTKETLELSPAIA